MNKIFNRCCLNGMKELPDNSIDLICTDLPLMVHIQQLLSSYGFADYGNNNLVSFTKMSASFSLSSQLITFRFF